MGHVNVASWAAELFKPPSDSELTAENDLDDVKGTALPTQLHAMTLRDTCYNAIDFDINKQLKNTEEQQQDKRHFNYTLPVILIHIICDTDTLGFCLNSLLFTHP